MSTSSRASRVSTGTPGRLHRAAALGVLAVALLSGCRADVATVAVVDGPGQVRASYEVSVSGALADALRADPATDQGIMDRLARAAGSPAVRVDDGQAITWTASAAQADALAGDLTGVSSITASGPPEQLVTMVQVVTPSRLEQAVVAAAAGKADADARTVAYRRATTVTVRLELPGPVTEVTGMVPGTVDGNLVVLSASLDALAPGPIRVRSARAGTDWLLLVALALAAGGAGYGVVAYLARRRSR